MFNIITSENKQSLLSADKVFQDITQTDFLNLQNPISRYYHYPHFTDEDTKAQKTNLPNFLKLINSKARF